MSDDAASSSAAAASLSTTYQRDHAVDDDQGRLQAAGAVPMAAQMAERRKKDRQLFNKKRGELLDGLQRELDIYVYAQLSIIYYMEYAVSLSEYIPRTTEADALVAAPSLAS